MINEKENFKFNVTVPPKGKGLIINISMDTNNGGTYCNWSKYRFEFCLWFIAVRFFFMSEEHYNALQALVTMKEIVKTHDFIIGDKDV